MINTGYLRWKLNQEQRAIETDVAAVETDVGTLQTDVTAVEGDVSTLQTDVTAVENDVVAVQDSAEAQTEALAAAAGQCNAPTFFFAGSVLTVGFYTTTASATIRYRVNAGSWNTYSTPVTLTIGDYIEGQAQKGGLTDSGITLYDT